MIPDKTLIRIVFSISHFKMKYTKEAIRAIINDPILTVLHSGINHLAPYRYFSLTSEKRVWIANQTPRLSTTPTTAAVIPESAVVKLLLPRRYSI